LFQNVIDWWWRLIDWLDLKQNLLEGKHSCRKTGVSNKHGTLKENPLWSHCVFNRFCWLIDWLIDWLITETVLQSNYFYYKGFLFKFFFQNVLLIFSVPGITLIIKIQNQITNTFFSARERLFFNAKLKYSKF